jgi:hypothetical protein
MRGLLATDLTPQAAPQEIQVMAMLSIINESPLGDRSSQTTAVIRYAR